MSILESLPFGGQSQLPLVHQTETTECALACLCMVVGYHGHRVDLATLRQRYQVSLKGVTLTHVMAVAKQLNLATRPLKLELEELSKLQTPSILHWNLDHFVVLKSVGPKYITIHDPATGIRKITFEVASKSFTGVALELWPNQDFTIEEPVPLIRLRDLAKGIRGLRRSMATIFGLALCLEVISLINPLFVQLVIDNVVVSADRDLLTTLALGFLILMLMSQAISALRSWLMLYMGTTLNVQWRANIFDHLIQLPTSYFERRHLGDVVSRFGSIDQIQRTLTTSFLESLLDGLMALITLAMMLVYSPSLSLVVLGAMVVYAGIRCVWYPSLKLCVEEQISHSAKQQSHFLETIRGIKPIKLYQRQDQRRSLWISLLVNQVNADVKTQKLQLLYRTINGLLFGIEAIIIVWLGAKSILDGLFSVGVLMAFISYKTQFVSRASSLIDKYFEFRMLRIHVDRLSDIVTTQVEPVEGHLTASEIELLDSTIEIRRLHYRFSEHEPFVLDGINLTIKAGESVALVGPSGCGKTTLMNLILGILQPTRGEVLIGGQIISKLGVSELRKIVGTVTQDDVLFAGSIADNISFFDTAPDLAWLERCAVMAAISDEISSLPMGYNTLVGDMGTALSGGQKQRILLARALYCRPKILLLDEATSHLDLAREKQVNSAIKALHITRVIIAHRPETIQTADRMVVVANGRVVTDASLKEANDVKVEGTSDYIPSVIAAEA